MTAVPSVGMRPFRNLRALLSQRSRFTVCSCSSDAARSDNPGLNEAFGRSLSPGSHRQLLDIPESDRLVVAGGGERQSVGRKDDRHDDVLMTLERGQFRAAGDVP